MQLPVGMGPAIRAPGNVISVVDSLDIEGDMMFALDESEVPPRLRDLRERDKAAFRKFVHGFNFQLSPISTHKRFGKLKSLGRLRNKR